MSFAVLSIFAFEAHIQFQPYEDMAEAVTKDVEETPPTQSPTPTAAIERFSSPARRYTHSGVNLREGPGTDFRLIGSVPANTALDAIGKQGDWYVIRRDDRKVYVAAWLTHDAPLPVSDGGQDGGNQQKAVNNCCDIGWQCATDAEWIKGYNAFQQNQCERNEQPAQDSSSEAPQSSQPSFICNCSITCSEMSSCEEARFQLDECKCWNRDYDGDGIPCESLCG